MDAPKDSTDTKAPTTAFRTTAVLANLLVPGAGWVWLGRWRAGALIQLYLIGSLVVLCWSRLVLEPWAIMLYATMALVVYLIGTGLSVTTKRVGSHSKLRSFARTLAFMLLSLVLLFAGFFYKDKWLGMHIYFVPSMSMHPTLKTGQFILVDTWAYSEQVPKKDDIVVFALAEGEAHMVKRIAAWPNGELRQSGKWYVLGDNQLRSRDSRIFGGITQDQIEGRARMVLYDIDPDIAYGLNGHLQPIH